MSAAYPERTRGDGLLAALAAYTAQADAALDPAAARHARHIVMDTLAVALGALDHPAVGPAQAFAAHARLADGATIWGSMLRTTADCAALVNGVPLRGYDYNDLYIGASGGHPSDMVPGLIGLAETRRLSGARLLEAVAVGYEVTLDLLDAIDIDAPGWDYPVVTGIGAACAASRLLGLTADQAAEAIAITAITNFATDEVESGDLNARGDLTMWKRFNGGNAVRQATLAALLAEAGVEGAVRPFEGGHGFLSKVGTTPQRMAGLFDRLGARTAPARMFETQFKRWPVGSRAQSAIQAALQARAGAGDVRRAQKVAVRCDRDVYAHLLARRADPWHPVSRETADHSLAYIVTAALLDGAVRPGSFDPAVVAQEERQAFMNGKLSIAADEALSQGAAGGFLAEVRIVDEHGREHLGRAAAPPGHRSRPFTGADFDEKFHENVAPVLGEPACHALSAAIRRVDAMADINELTTLLRFDAKERQR